MSLTANRTGQRRRACVHRLVVWAVPFLFCLVFVSFSVSASPIPRIILDTDLSTDIDDVGAVGVLHALADLGSVQILAMMVSSGDPWSGPCLQELNSFLGRPGIPVGVIAEPTVRDTSRYTGPVVEQYHELTRLPPPVPADRLYRETLAQQPDGSVTIVTIGYLSNLARLLRTGPDKFSPLTGEALVAKKVKRMVCMGGQYPQGREWNFYRDISAAQATIRQWPTPIRFVGFEIGRKIMTGSVLRSTKPGNPFRLAYRLYNNISDRESWDQVAVLAVIGDESFFDGSPWEWSSPGTVVIAEDGSNTWRMDLTGSHRYMMWCGNTVRLGTLIDRLLLRVVSQADSPIEDRER